MTKQMWIAALVVSVGSAFAAADAAAEPVRCKAQGGWSHGYCGRLHSKNPESWVRGSAAVETTTGVVTMKLQLETDSMAAGPCGKMTAHLRDREGRDVATLSMGKEICRGGKIGGKAASDEYSFQKVIPVAHAQRVTSVVVALEYPHTMKRLMNIRLKDIADAVKIVLPLL